MTVSYHPGVLRLRLQTRIMARASETLIVVECCQNELLRQLLPTLFSGLESCQKSLESYLEGKRNKFPRFYFVSNPVLLKILSQGSDAETVQDDLGKLFDAISRVGNCSFFPVCFVGSSK